eukprot:TRINITY_DN37290_c0_g1_i1.p1 TRINITY_DN37290_c0_g1~~TRINITY_DN37290_c0_g1_i1.p1  ORF type:complete len:369 (-),score=72.31 TRINITY_DN37290_c0_g1_i1:142-1248(-)
MQHAHGKRQLVASNSVGVRLLTAAFLAAHAASVITVEQVRPQKKVSIPSQTIERDRNATILKASARNRTVQLGSANGSVVHSPKLQTEDQNGSAPDSARERVKALDAALIVAREQVVTESKELKVQQGLVKEKTDAANHARQRARDLAARVDKLQKEAEVASEIAKEKAEAKVKAEQEQRKAEEQAKQLDAEENVTVKLERQIKNEEHDLEDKVAKLEADRKNATQALLETKATQPKLRRAPTSNATNSGKPTAALNATTKAEIAARVSTNASKSKGSFISKVSHVAVGATNSSALDHAHVEAQNATVMNEAMQQLQAENQRLRREKDELERKLKAKQVAREREQLRGRLKNKLVRADRKLKIKNKKH